MVYMPLNTIWIGHSLGRGRLDGLARLTMHSLPSKLEMLGSSHRRWGLGEGRPSHSQLEVDIGLWGDPAQRSDQIWERMK